MALSRMQTDVDTLYPFIRWPVDESLVAGLESHQAAHMISVMVGDQYCSQTQLMFFQGIFDNLRIPGVDDRGDTVMMDKPYIVVVERCQPQHLRMIDLHEPSVTSPWPSDPWRRWLGGVAGQYLLNWEREHLDQLVTNWFGYHAIQLGLGVLPALQSSRISTRLLVEDSLEHIEGAQLLVDGFESLPFADESVDLVVVPHALEFASDPHQVLREVVRVLRPEGKVVVIGLNPVSLWRMQQGIARVVGQSQMPREGQWIAMPRIRDWLKLLSCEIDAVSYGCYRPICGSSQWVERTRFLERAGDRWWPICGAVYTVSAVKRVTPLRLIGPAWRAKQRRAKGALTPVARKSFEGNDVE